MAEAVVFIESFDHTGPGYAYAKYLHLTGTYSQVTGPYQGQAARFAGVGNDVGPANQGTLWDAGAWSAAVWVDAAGWTGPGEAGLLAPAMWSTAPLDYPHHWLTVDQTGTLRVRSWAATSGATVAVLAQSAAGALPLGAWCRLEYQTQIRGVNTSAGTVGVRVNGTVVLSASGLVTSDRQRPSNLQADHFRFGQLQTSATNTGGVAGLGTGGG